MAVPPCPFSLAGVSEVHGRPRSLRRKSGVSFAVTLGHWNGALISYFTHHQSESLDLECREVHTCGQSRCPGRFHLPAGWALEGAASLSGVWGAVERWGSRGELRAGPNLPPDVTRAAVNASVGPAAQCNAVPGVSMDPRLKVRAPQDHLASAPAPRGAPRATHTSAQLRCKFRVPPLPSPHRFSNLLRLETQESAMLNNDHFSGKAPWSTRGGAREVWMLSP